MSVLKEKDLIIIEFLLDKYKDTKSSLQKNIYEIDLIKYIKDNDLSSNNEVLIKINKDCLKVYEQLIEYNYKNKEKTFDDYLEKIFKNENYEDYVSNLNLENDIKEDIKKIKEITKGYRVTDELIAKLINTLKARIPNQTSVSNDLLWAPEAKISIELLKIFLEEKVELYYVNPVESDVRFYSNIDTIIIDQRFNKNWIERNKEFLLKNDIEVFVEAERTILSELLDFLPELEKIKCGISTNFPERYVENRLEFILKYFEKSEMNALRKSNALKIINVFFNNFIFNNNENAKTFEKCNKIIKLIEENTEKTIIDEKKLSIKSKREQNKNKLQPVVVVNKKKRRKKAINK